jgi:hypothetical protein
MRTRHTRSRHRPPPGRRIAPPDDRLRRAIQYPRAVVMESRGRGVLDTPLSRSMTIFVRSGTTLNSDSVIPGRCEASNPESRDSGSGPLDHPGMTASRLLRGIYHRAHIHVTISVLLRARHQRMRLRQKKFKSRARPPRAMIAYSMARNNPPATYILRFIVAASVPLRSTASSMVAAT